MDGVLIDAMPFHAEAFQIAFREKVNLDIDKKDVFLLEGMPGLDLVKEIFKRRKIKPPDDNLIESISERKKQLFKQIEKAKAFDGVKELIVSLNCKNCLKAVVSGASEREVESLLKKNDLNNFDLVISGEDSEKGKPSPEPFSKALSKLNLKPDDALVVENSPLGVNSALKANLRYIVTLNNTPLDLKDFNSLGDGKEIIREKIFKDTKSASKFLKDWCCKS